MARQSRCPNAHRARARARAADQGETCFAGASGTHCLCANAAWDKQRFAHNGTGDCYACVGAGNHSTPGSCINIWDTFGEQSDEYHTSPAPDATHGQAANRTTTGPATGPVTGPTTPGNASNGTSPHTPAWCAEDPVYSTQSDKSDEVGQRCTCVNGSLKGAELFRHEARDPSVDAV